MRSWYFPNPKEFEMGRPGINAADMSKSIGWADYAVEDGDYKKPNSHSCPGKELSKAMIIAFWEERLRSDQRRHKKFNVVYNHAILPSQCVSIVVGFFAIPIRVQGLATRPLADSVGP